MRPVSGTRWRLLGAALATLATAASVFIALCWPDVFDAVLAREMRVTPGSRAHAQWVKPSLPLYFDVRLFNWTNAEKWAGGEKPRLEQLGPYRFRETREKVELVFHSNGSASYRTRRTWSFEPDSSNGSLSDRVTTLNAIAASASHRARLFSSIQQQLVSMGLSMTLQEHYVRRSAGELMFEGYEDALLSMAKAVPTPLTEGVPAFDRFGWFYQRNGSLDNDGHMTVSSGGGGVGGALAGQILRWNYDARARHLPAACSHLHGSLGEMFPRRAGSEVSLFSPDLCRPLPFTRADGARAVHGVPVARYAAGARMLDNGTALADNACFCGGECVLAGALNVSACRYGAPAFISLPHFYAADPQYRADVDGLAPDADKHSFYFDIEPTTGVPLDVAARFQLNYLVTPNPNIALYRRVPRVMFPILWVEQRVTVGAEQARDVGAARAAAAWGGVGVAALAAAFFSLAVCLLAPRCRRAPATNASPPERTALVRAPPHMTALVCASKPELTALVRARDELAFSRVNTIIYDEPAKLAT